MALKWQLAGCWERAHTAPKDSSLILNIVEVFGNELWPIVGGRAIGWSSLALQDDLDGVRLFSI